VRLATDLSLNACAISPGLCQLRRAHARKFRFGLADERERPVELSQLLVHERYLSARDGRPKSVTLQLFVQAAPVILERATIVAARLRHCTNLVQ
jgi:hypothetical protein